MEITERLLQTGLNLLARGLTEPAERILQQVPEELCERNKTMRERLYPNLGDARYLQDENERLERLARAERWEALLEGLSRQLARERRAVSVHSLSSPL